ncbi:MAG: hypothetical protein LIP09_04240 [Bacteroidales bacterium]|nr:hypothetical protein [Bacteroidales bacterium]
MKKQNFCNKGLILAMAIAVLGLTASCSDDDIKGPSNGSDSTAPEETQIEASPMSIVTDPDLLGQYVTNYSSASRAAAADYKTWETYLKANNSALKAAIEEYDGITLPESYDQYVTLTSLDFRNGDYTSDEKGETNFVSTANLTSRVDAADKKRVVYVTSGKLTVTECGSNLVTFIIVGQGQLEINGDFAGNAFNFSSKPILITKNSPKGLIVSDEIEATVDIIPQKNGDSAGVIFAQKFKGASMTVNANASVAIACFDLSGTLKVDSNTLFTEWGGACNAIDFNGSGNLTMANGAIVRAYNGMTMQPRSSQVNVIQIEDHESSEYAVIQAETADGKKSTITLNTKEAFAQQFGDSYVILYGTIAHESGGGTATTPENVIIDEAKEYYVPSSGCGSAYGTPSVTPFPEFVNIADIDPTHTHPISATCIAVNGNEAYVSWHLRGGNVWGCVEKIIVDGSTDKVTLDAWMETPAWLAYSDPDDEYQTVSGKEKDDITKHGTDRDNAYDFNHLIYHNDYLLLVGDHDKKGGFIGRIKIADIKSAGEDWTGNSMDILTARQLGKDNSTVAEDGTVTADIEAGRSGNSLIVGQDADGNDELWIVSRGGYQIMDYADNGANFSVKSIKVDGQGWVSFSPWKDAKSTDNSVKHIAKSPTGAIATIEYVDVPKDEEYMWWNDNATQLKAEIKIWSNPWSFSADLEPTSTIEVPAFGPIYGKNVIAFDSEGYLYSCQGWNGVAKYSTSGAEVARINIPDWMDANYDLLKKDTAAKTPDPNRYRGSAANGLCIDGDYVYVANGGAGVWELTKSALVPVRYFMNNESASANYVQPLADNGNKYLVVAYGRAGIRVFKL